MDRFLMRLSMGLPTLPGEVSMLTRFLRASPLAQLNPVCSAQEVARAQEACREVAVHPALLDYVARLCRATRGARGVACGASPRGTLALLRASQAHAMLMERGFVTRRTSRRSRRQCSPTGCCRNAPPGKTCGTW